MVRQIYFFSNPKLFMYIYYVNIIRLFYRIWYFFNPKPPLTLKISKDETQLYIEKQTKRFLTIFPYKDEESKKRWNNNIDERCYSLESFQELMADENNELEPDWKRRLLIEYTPRGNIIMYYDIFKQAFAYVSDQHMNYAILNACAMKYVQLFYCVDFFMDESILPEGIISPFFLLQQESENKEKEKQSEKKRELGISFKDAPFAKLKTYRSSVNEIIQQKKVVLNETESKRPPKIEMNNNFRYLGKISNLNILQKSKPIVKLNPLIQCPVESFDYLAYKNRNIIN